MREGDGSSCSTSTTTVEKRERGMLSSFTLFVSCSSQFDWTRNSLQVQVLKEEVLAGS